MYVWKYQSTPLGMYHRLKSSTVFLFYELSNHTMCNQPLVLYFKLMIYDEAQATVKYLNYCYSEYFISATDLYTCTVKE